MKHAIADYRSCADSVFGQIAQGWSGYTNFWRVGNAFTTLIDYFVGRKKGDPALVRHAVDLFNRDYTDPTLWYDDFSWWGVAFLQASQHTDLVGSDEATWRGLAQKCWDEMAPATQVWHNADKNIFAKAKPRFDGGCWNRCFVPLKCDPLHPTEAWPACGIQNTVTNTQYLVFAARFSQVKDAKRQCEWLRQWFFDDSLSDDEKLLASYKEGQLVRERVSTYAQAADAVPNYKKDRHWTGDQGILLGALLEMARLDPDRQSVYYAVARTVLDAVRTKLVNDEIHQILQPWTPAATMGTAYLTDYSTGVGVYMRYLLYAYKDGVLKPHIASKEYKDFIQANADSICDSQGKLTPCPPLPDGITSMDPRECLLNRLAVLNAAIEIIGP